MKSLFLVTVLAILAVTYALTVTPEAKETVRKAASECIKETGVDKTVVKKTRENIFAEDDPKLKKYLLCFSKKFNAITDAGEIDTEAIRKNTSDKLTTEQIDTILSKCIHKKPTPEETAFALWKCWRQNVPPFPVD